ncbi:MAG TPA: hypothetical protein VGK01_24390 [Candidatus Angelobacter sp.]|jgi:hypothetical protein|nr:hypothetical protein [Candidatus Udaeobacter sp.]
MIDRDRLYELLPVVYRQRDADQGYPLRALLQLISEQVEIVEGNIDQLYENWFIETCEDWVVPYIGDLIGYQAVHEAGEPGDTGTAPGRQRNKILIPRSEVANTIGNRRRKGTLSLLEELAREVAGWPVRAGEFYKQLGWTQQLDYPQPNRGRTVDLRHGGALDLLNGPFDEAAHTADVRRANSLRTGGRYNIPSAALFVWRLKTYSVTQTPAYCVDERQGCYTFSVLGNDTQLYNRPQAEAEPTHIAGELNLPTPIRLRHFEKHKTDYYGEAKSLYISIGSPRQAVLASRVIPADLSDWTYRSQNGVAVDPVLGRIVFPPDHSPEEVVWVSYRYAFSADIGGGEYNRPLSQPANYDLYRVGEQETYKTINDALAQWRQDEDGTTGPGPRQAVIEINDSGLYEERLDITLREYEALQLRAANRKRPVINISNTRLALPDALNVRGGRGSRFTLDGLLIAGRGIQVSGYKADKAHPELHERGDLCDVTIRHCTLVPGWDLDCDCEPQHSGKPSLRLSGTRAQIKIEHSILGPIQVMADRGRTDPIRITISDSILDATSEDHNALSGIQGEMAYVRLTIARSTVFGIVLAHEIALAENSIFKGHIGVAHRQAGCVRFCYVPPGSRTPRRYECQPDLVERVITDLFAQHKISAAERDSQREAAQLRVEPEFNAFRYGKPVYCQLSAACAQEITRGAEDESEMGVFHDLYQPQRAANLRARLDDYTPAGMDAGIIYAT